MAGTFFLMREVELAAARVEHVTKDADGKSASGSLPTPMMDPRAEGSHGRGIAAAGLDRCGLPARSVLSEDS